MARGKKKGDHLFKAGNPGGPGRPRMPLELRELRKLQRSDLEIAVRNALGLTEVECLEVMNDPEAEMKDKLTLAVLMRGYAKGDQNVLAFVSDFIFGAKPKQIEVQNVSAAPEYEKTFYQFCVDAGYPAPFDKQRDMRDFCFDDSVPRLLLGSRGYGKTDYLTILGIAYEIYRDPMHFTALIVTKSEEKNAAIVSEISKALIANGMSLEKQNASCLRVAGLHGKDHSVSTITTGTSSTRGRHPKIIFMDDPVTPEDTSAAVRKKVESLYNELTKLTNNIVIIGQPVHKFDLFQKLRPLLKKMEVPYGSIPQLDADLEAQRLAGVTEDSIQKSYFLVVPSEGETPFDKISYLDTFPIGDTAVAYIDPSFKGGDYTALTVFKSHFDGVAVQGHVWKKAWNHCIEDFLKICKTFHVKRLCIECNSLGDQPVIALGQAFNGTGCGVVGKDSTQNKHSRIMSAGAYAPLIHLSRQSDKLYIDQVVQYEYGAEYDDAPDSLATGLEWIGLLRGKQNKG